MCHWSGLCACILVYILCTFVRVCLGAGSDYTSLLVLQLSTVLHMVSEWRSLRMRVFKIVEGEHVCKDGMTRGAVRTVQE